jgi:hypothetical protein
VSGRRYDGPALDGTVQYLGEAPHWQGDGETVAVSETPDGKVSATNVPVPGADRPDDVDGQTTFDDWGWSG